WIPDNMSITLVSVPPLGRNRGVESLSHSTSIQELFQRTHETASSRLVLWSVLIYNIIQFSAMYKRRAFLHWYTGEGMDLMEFSEAESNSQDLMYVLLSHTRALPCSQVFGLISAEYQQVRLVQLKCS
ncbi:Tubulin/FtsZ, partial [Mycena galericulata]